MQNFSILVDLSNELISISHIRPSGRRSVVRDSNHETLLRNLQMDPDVHPRIFRAHDSNSRISGGYIYMASRIAQTRPMFDRITSSVATTKFLSHESSRYPLETSVIC